ncbi:hypothetical protein ES703_38305 [subsurface metagenome]
MIFLHFSISASLITNTILSIRDDFSKASIVYAKMGFPPIKINCLLTVEFILLLLPAATIMQ